jgi:hypothetical protein
MRLEQVKGEIKDLGKSPVAEKLYPITSDWVPITDVLAIINRFEKSWKQRMEATKNSSEAALMKEILGSIGN